MPPANEKRKLGTVETTLSAANPTQKAETASAGIDPVLTADTLATPAPRVNPPAPQMASGGAPRTQPLIDSVAVNTERFIQSNSAEAQRANQLIEEIGGQQFDGAGERARLNEQFNIAPNLARLTDIQTTLASRNADTAIQKTQIQNAAGQTIGQAQREITQADREAAIRNAGLAAEASVLQGNIEAATTLVNQAMSDFYADRQLRNQNMIQQLDYYSRIADQQTAQLLGQEERKYQELLTAEKRRYEEDQRKIERVQNSVDLALQQGATPGEVAKLTNPNTTDDERLALAQLIQARGATQLRNLQMQSARLDMTVKAEQLAKLRQPTVATRDTQVVEVGDQKQLVDTQTGEVIATFGADVTVDEIQQAKAVQFVNTLDGLKDHPGMAKAVGPTKLARFTPFTVDVMTGEVSDFTGSVENVIKTLTLNTYAEAKAKGMTFGAMSQGEWDILGQSATKISQWRRERDDGSIFYEITEAKMKEELDSLSQFAKMDGIRKGAEPAQFGVSVMDDGTYWTQNSDGTYTNLPVTPLTR